ncbi:lethal (1) G0320 [Carabus blaptoides fortunei]
MKNFFLLALLVLPAILFTVDNVHKFMAYAEDELEDELVDVEGENDADDVAVTDEDEDEAKTTTSPDADTTILFIKPIIVGSSQMELPGGHPVEFLVGFRNKGKQDFLLESLEASFRYPMDFNFYIQNFSAIAYNRLVKPDQEATLMYSFLPSEAFAGRPFGLNINLNYRHYPEGGIYQEPVYNETVQIIELEEGLDGETFFLYLFLAAGVVLLLVVGQQFLSSLGRKRTSRKTVVETGTNNPNNVDYDWLPKQTLQQINKQMEKSPKQNKNKQQSPRQRKVKRSAGSDD